MATAPTQFGMKAMSHDPLRTVPRAGVSKESTAPGVINYGGMPAVQGPSSIPSTFLGSYDTMAPVGGYGALPDVGGNGPRQVSSTMYLGYGALPDVGGGQPKVPSTTFQTDYGGFPPGALPASPSPTVQPAALSVQSDSSSLPGNYLTFGSLGQPVPTPSPARVPGELAPGTYGALPPASSSSSSTTKITTTSNYSDIPSASPPAGQSSPQIHHLSFQPPPASSAPLGQPNGRPSPNPSPRPADAATKVHSAGAVQPASNYATFPVRSPSAPTNPVSTMTTTPIAASPGAPEVKPVAHYKDGLNQAASGSGLSTSSSSLKNFSFAQLGKKDKDKK